VSGARPLVVSAYLKAQSGNDCNYFIGETFTKSGQVWHRSAEPVYWPLGGSLDMMAYSSSSPFSDASVMWAPHNAALRVRIAVDEGRTQDDVMFGVAYDARMDDVSGTGHLGMNHSQAWIGVVLQKSAGYGHEVRVTKVELLDTYIGGDLTIENDHGYPKATWDMRRFTARAVIVDDTDGVYGTPLTSTEVSVGFLIPQQEMKPIRVTYTVDGVEKTAVHELQHAYWQMGQRYVYRFVFGKPVHPFAGLEIAPAPLYYDGTNFVIKDSDWNHDSYNSVFGQTEGSYYFNWNECHGVSGVSFDGKNDWRMPSQAEWAAVTTGSRTGSTINGASGCRYALIQLIGVTHAGNSEPIGLLLAPDGETMTGISKTFTWNVNSTSGNTGVTAAQLDEYLYAGCVFLPASGRFNGSSWNDAGASGIYWSSTELSSTYGYYLLFLSSYVNPSSNSSRSSIYFQCRLVRTAN